MNLININQLLDRIEISATTVHDAHILRILIRRSPDLAKVLSTRCG